MRTCARKTLGITLVELMIVVVIIGILAAISMVGYRKYIARARTSEATAMLAEIAAKEQLYFLDNGEYLTLHADGYVATEESNLFWPSDPGASFDSVRTPVSVYGPDGKLPIPWQILGIRPRWGALYCTYMANAGAADAAPPGVIGPTVWTATPAVPWFYALAACNLFGIAGWRSADDPDNYVTVMILAHDAPVVRTLEENK